MHASIWGKKSAKKKILGVFHVLHRSQVQKKGHFSQFHSKKCNYLQPFLWQQSLQNIFISNINLYSTLIGTIIIIYDNFYCTLETIFLLELWQNRNSFSARDSKFGDCRIMKKSSAGLRISFPNRESNKVFYLMRKLFHRSHT